MEKIRFTRFALLLGGLQKCLQKVKLVNAAEVGLKGVHMLWLYELSQHPEGMSASELAADSSIDRSLISREINVLEKEGYILFDSTGDKHRYNCKIRLTERGEELAARIGLAGLHIQERIGEDISDEDLQTFYRTFEALHKNFVRLLEEEPEPVLGEVSKATNQKINSEAENEELSVE